jgi:hypothetical protein
MSISFERHSLPGSCIGLGNSLTAKNAKKSREGRKETLMKGFLALFDALEAT